MKGLCTRLLLSVTCFSLCLTFASPVRAGENAAQVFPQVQADTELPYEMPRRCSLKYRQILSCHMSRKMRPCR